MGNMADKIKDWTEIKAMFIEAYKNSLGNICKALEMMPPVARPSRQQVYKWIDADPDFKNSLTEAMELQKDFAENALLQRIREGDTTAIIFYLKTKAKDRGYSEKVEVSAKPDTKEITFEF